MSVLRRKKAIKSKPRKSSIKTKRGASKSRVRGRRYHIPNRF